MPTITLNKHVLMENLGKEVPDDILKERISYLGTDLDEVGDDEIVVEVFPNRPDLLSEQGFARALSSFMGIEEGLREYKVKRGWDKVLIDESVEEVRPYTTCAIVKGLDLDHEKIVEIINIQEKLHVTFGRNRRKVAIGLYPLEKIETPIHYKALEPEKIKFQPLEGDRTMSAEEILEEHPKGKAFGHLLEDCEKYPVFMDDDGKFLSMPPIINSHDVGKVDEGTKELFIECSGHDLGALQQALNILVTTFSDMGADVYSMKLDYPDNTIRTPDLEPSEMEVDLDYVNKKLGLDINKHDLELLLGRMGFGYKRGRALVPAYRTDVLHQIDLVEDIAIAYGFDKFDEEIPDVSTIGKKDPKSVVEDKVRDVLVGHGLLEVKNYSLSNRRVQDENMNIDLVSVTLANSLSEEYDVLRAWLIPCLLKTLKDNRHESYPQNLFEIGTIFKQNDDYETRVEEARRTAVALCGEDADYTKAKQILESVFDALGVEAEYEETEHPSFIEGRAARVYVEGEGVVYIGEVHPEVLESFGLEMPCAVFELNLTDLIEVTGIV